MASVAGMLNLVGHYDEAGRYAEEVISLARMLGARKVEGHALTTLGSVEGLTGNLAQGIAHIRAGRELSKAESAVDDLMRSYANGAFILDRGGELREAAMEALEGLALEGRIGLHGNYGFFHTANAAGSLIRLGDWAEAERLLDFEIPRGTRAIALFNVLLQRTTLAVRQGRLEEAGALYSRWMEESRDAIDSQTVGPIHAIGAELAWWQGRLEEGLGLVLEGIQLVDGTEDWSYSLALFTVGLAILAELARELPEQIDEWRDEAGRIWDRAAPAPPQSPDIPARVAQCRAELARVEGRIAPGLWGDAAALWAAIPQPYEEAYARFRQAEALADAGSPAEAAVLLEEARTTVRRLGARPLESLIDQLATRFQLER